MRGILFAYGEIGARYLCLCVCVFVLLLGFASLEVGNPYPWPSEADGADILFIFEDGADVISCACV